MAAFFVSYARADASHAGKLLDLLRPLWKTSAEISFRPWRDTAILPGERWKEEIGLALEEADFGLLLLSPEFFASDFITKEELTPLLAKPMVIPVMLHPIVFGGAMNLCGVEDHQVFRDEAGRAFSECRTSADQRAFALWLFRQMVATCKKYGIC